MMQLNYHKKSFDLLGYQPKFNKEQYTDLPPSVREWYSCDINLDLLRKYSNDDIPIHPLSFERQSHNNKELTIFMYENQAVFWWAFERSNQDDPPVYINLNPPKNAWILCCDHFSEFIYTRLFDFMHWHEDGLVLTAGGKPLDQKVLNFLEAEFTLEPTTQNGYSLFQHRFSHNGQKITIFGNDMDSEWHLSADSPAELRTIFEKLENLFDWHHS